MRHDFDELKAFQRATYAQTPKADRDEGSGDAPDPEDPDRPDDRGPETTGRGKDDEDESYDW